LPPTVEGRPARQLSRPPLCSSGFLLSPGSLSFFCLCSLPFLLCLYLFSLSTESVSFLFCVLFVRPSVFVPGLFSVVLEFPLFFSLFLLYLPVPLASLRSSIVLSSRLLSLSISISFFVPLFTPFSGIPFCFFFSGLIARECRTFQ